MGASDSKLFSKKSKKRSSDAAAPPAAAAKDDSMAEPEPNEAQPMQTAFARRAAVTGTKATKTKVIDQGSRAAAADHAFVQVRRLGPD